MAAGAGVRGEGVRVGAGAAGERFVAAVGVGCCGLGVGDDETRGVAVGVDVGVTEDVGDDGKPEEMATIEDSSRVDRVPRPPHATRLTLRPETAMAITIRRAENWDRTTCDSSDSDR